MMPEDGAPPQPSQLDGLCAELEQSIRSIATAEESDKIINDAKQSNSVATQLFKGYNSLVKAQKESLERQVEASDTHEVVLNPMQGDTDAPEMTELDDIDISSGMPMFLYQGSGRQVAGWNALKRNIFWIRLAAALCCLLSFSIVSGVPFIDSVEVPAYALLEESCDDLIQEGQFEYDTYHFVLSMGVISFTYSLVFCLYYLLPVDSQEKKYFPGTRFTPPVVLCPFQSGASSRYLEVLADFLLVVLCLGAAIGAAAQLDTAVAFENAESTEYVSECIFGVCDSGACVKDNGECEACDDGVDLCADGSCPNPDGVCENECDESERYALPLNTKIYFLNKKYLWRRRCLNGECPRIGPDNDEAECDYGPEGKLVYTKYSRPGIPPVFYVTTGFIATLLTDMPMCRPIAAVLQFAHFCEHVCQ